MWTGAYNLDFDTDSLIATIRQVGAAERVGIVSVAEGGAHVVCTARPSPASTLARYSSKTSRELSLLAPCAESLLSDGRHNRTSDGLLPMRAVAGVESLMSRPP